MPRGMTLQQRMGIAKPGVSFSQIPKNQREPKGNLAKNDPLYFKMQFADIEV